MPLECFEDAKHWWLDVLAQAMLRLCFTKVRSVWIAYRRCRGGVPALRLKTGEGLSPFKQMACFETKLLTSVLL